MKLWVVTGGIATGKSYVSKALAQPGEGIWRFSSDEAVAAAYRDPQVQAAVKSELGVSISKGGISPAQRKELRDLITLSAAAKVKLEAILHPYAFAALEAKCVEASNAGVNVLVAEIPLYYETGRALAVDRLIVVASTRATQLERLQKSRGLTKATSEEMLRLQLPIEAKAEGADVVIWNDGSLLALERQIQLVRTQFPPLEEKPHMNEETTIALPEGQVAEAAAVLDTEPAADGATVTASPAPGPEEVTITNSNRKAEDSKQIPEELSIDEMQSMSPAALQALADSVGWRVNASRNKHQLIFDLMGWTGSRGARFKVEGVLDIDAQGFGMVRYERYSFRPMPEDVFLPSFLIRKFGLLSGQRISGIARMPKERDKYASLDRIVAIEGIPLEQWQVPTHFDKLTALFPSKRIILETKKDSSISSRVVDIVAPLGKGQRGLIVASPRSGKTMLLKDIARSITANHPEIHLIVLLLDERPEEVTDFEETVSGCEIFSSTFDESPKRHTQVAELVSERAKRLVELKKDVVILLDSITRLSRGYNALGGGKGRTMSGGMDAKAMIKPKKFFGAARNVEEGGSLTVIATALVETESRMDDLIFEEFKGTGNMEINLDREMAERRLYPAIHVTKSGTRRDDLLYHPEELRRISVIRRQLASVPAMEAIETLVKNMHKVKTNAELLMLGLR